MIHKSNLIFLLGLLCIIGVTSCENDMEDLGKESKAYKKTVLLYMAAQNSLGYGDFSNYYADSMEIIKGCQFLDESNCLIAFVDNGNTPCLYQFTKNHPPQLIKAWDKDIFSTSPETLKEILKLTRTNFPSEEYALVLWSHADGWLPPTNNDYDIKSSPKSFGIDVGEDGYMNTDRTKDYNFGSQMDINDMASAIHESGTSLKYIFFDACLMQSIEVCYALRNTADYIIASPIAIAANGANYTNQIRKGLFSSNVCDIIHTYYEDVTDPMQAWDYSDYGVVFSVVKTEPLEKLASLMSEILPRSKVANKTSVNMDGVLNYHAYSSRNYYRPHQFDALESMERILTKEDFKLFNDLLNDIVISKVETSKFWIGPNMSSFQYVNKETNSGIAIFIPQDIYTENSSFTKHGDINTSFQKTQWYKDAGWENTQW